jgi:mRNA interferase MazF
MGREQSGIRPVLVISNDLFNLLANTFYIIVPITRTDRGLTYQYRVGAGEGGLSKDSVLLCDHVRSVSIERFLRRRGNISEATLATTRGIIDRFVENMPEYTRGT